MPFFFMRALRFKFDLISCVSLASSSLAFTSASALTFVNQSKVQAKPVHSSNSLVHCLIKLMQKEANAGNQTILKQGFTLTATLTLSQECRGILWKVSAVHDFKL